MLVYYQHACGSGSYHCLTFISRAMMNRWSPQWQMSRVCTSHDNIRFFSGQKSSNTVMKQWSGIFRSTSPKLQTQIDPQRGHERMMKWGNPQRQKTTSLLIPPNRENSLRDVLMHDKSEKGDEFPGCWNDFEIPSEDVKINREIDIIYWVLAPYSATVDTALEEHVNRQMAWKEHRLQNSMIQTWRHVVCTFLFPTYRYAEWIFPH